MYLRGTCALLGAAAETDIGLKPGSGSHDSASVQGSTRSFF